MSGARPRGVLRGVFRLATGRADGIEAFGNTRAAFLGSLAPLIVVPVLAEALLALGGAADEGPAPLDLLATLCALLAPPVVSHWFAVRWGREAWWLRFATAFNWCQWAVPAAACVLLLLASGLIASGVSSDLAGRAWIFALAAYGLWLHWFIARHGLLLSRVRAAILVAGVNAITVATVLAPALAARMLTG
ncbi:MAG: hypothetical protein JSR21_08430 [Proteobacteria bacterium]|nr:hypothetical protein [Pseudomonadota bacterium]